VEGGMEEGLPPGRVGETGGVPTPPPAGAAAAGAAGAAGAAPPPSSSSPSLLPGHMAMQG